MGKYFCFLTLFGFMIVVFGAGATLAGTEVIGKNTMTKIDLDGNWFYHWGDFEFDAQGNPAGIHDAAAWKPYTGRRDMRRGSHTVMWFRRRLPEQAVPNPAIFVPSYTSYQAFDVYLDDHRIFTFCRSCPSFTLRHAYLKWHQIPLPTDFSGKELAMRFYSENPQYIGLAEALYIGEYNALIAHFVLRDVDLTILGILFSIIGGLGYLFLGKIYRWRNAALLSFATLATFSGIYLLAAESKLTQLFVDQVVVLSYLGSVSYFLFMAGMWGFLASTPWLGLKWVSRLLWQLHAACAVGVIALDAVNPVPVDTIHKGSLLVVGVGMLVVGAEMLRAVRREPQEARILGAGIGFFTLTSLYDVLVGLHVLWAPRVIYPWGQLVFLLSQVYVLTLRYQSERKTLQANMLQSARLASLGELAAGVAHEVNNPICGIISCAEILREDCREQGISAEIPDMIIKEGHRIAEITKKLLSFSRKQPQTIEPTSIGDVVDDALALTAKLLQKSRIAVTVDVPESLPMVLADGQQLQQVLINLLNNARYALDHAEREAQEEKIIDIRGMEYHAEDHDYVRIVLYDNGDGIPKELLDKIFDPFYSLKPRGEGTGLGLSISYGIVNEHGGRIALESEEGSYTRAIVDLPTIPEDE